MIDFCAPRLIVRLLLFCVVLCLGRADALASDRFWSRHIIRHVGMTEGLPSNFVDDICRDELGFIWFATGGSGLVRYDGYSYVTYDCSNTPTMRSNFVRAIASDAFGHIWVGTDRGLCCYDGRSERVDSVMIRDKNGESLTDGPIIRIVIDDNGIIWLASRHTVVCLKAMADNSVSLVGKYVFGRSVTALDRGSRGVYVASFSDIYVCSADTVCGSVSVRPDRRPSVEMANCVVETISESAGFLWIGSNAGLFRYNMATGEERRYVHAADNQRSITQNRVTDIASDDDGRVMVATLRGLNIYNYETDDFDHVTQDDVQDGKSLCSNFINCLISTNQGVWVGTDIAGADLLSPISLDVVNFTSDDICGGHERASTSRARSLRPVNSLLEDADGSLWVGTIEGGLSRRVRGGKTFENFTMASHGLCSNSVSALATDGDGNLWVATWGGGIDVLNEKNPNVRVEKHYFAGERMEGGLSSDYIGAMVYDSINKGMWVGTIRGIDFIKDGVISEPMGRSTFTDMDGALGACVDGMGRLWMGTSLGLFVIDLHSYDAAKGTVSFQSICHKLDDKNIVGDPRITFILYSEAKRKVLVGTNGFGILYCDATKPDLVFKSVSTSDGLVNNAVSVMAEDGDGNIWVGTSNGLTLLSADLNVVNSYTTADGLLSDCYYWNAAWSSRLTGHVFLGCVDGLSELGPSLKSVSAQTRRAPVLTRLDVNNIKEQPRPDGILTVSVECANSVVLHESNKSFGVEFSSLNYLAPASVRFQYRLDGFDNDWVTAPKGQHYAQYTNLSAGDYKLRVRYAAAHGKWSNERQIAITVTPYFYKTTWFSILVIMLIIAVVFLVFKYRMRYIEDSRKQLHHEVKMRTRQLEEQTTALEAKKQELEASNAKLVEQNNYIVRQKENILEMTSKIQRLSIDKLQFFTNVSHELRSPLTLITGPVKRAQALCNQPEVMTQLDLIERSSRTLLATVNQLMDFRKVEAGNFEMHPVSINIEEYIVSMVKPYVAYAAEQGINLRTFFHVGQPLVRVDSDAVTKIVANLLSNAIKYSAGGKVIDLFVCQITIDGQLRTYICVRDRGVGIPADQVNKIFDRFYQSTSSHQPNAVSTGIGLYVVNRIVTQCDGEISARNNPAGGVSMRVFLPTPAGRHATNADSPAKAEVAKTVESNNADDKGGAAESERMTILVVEDSKDMRLYIRTILEPEYKVIEAENGVNGLTALAENDIDFIVTDLMMPVMDGLEFARRVKADFAFSHTPILILTAQMNGAFQTEGYRIGVESYLYKPFDEDMLKARISGILASRRKNQNRFLNSLDTSDLNIERESEDEKFVERVTNFVKSRYKDPDFSIDDIVSEVGCSKSMLHKKMQSVMGQAPGNFIRTYRLNIAREILSDKRNRLNVSQVAYEVGFNDPKYFSRCFTKAFGYPPSMIN